MNREEKQIPKEGLLRRTQLLVHLSTRANTGLAAPYDNLRKCFFWTNFYLTFTLVPLEDSSEKFRNDKMEEGKKRKYILEH